MSDDLRALNELLGAAQRSYPSFGAALLANATAFFGNELVRLILSAMIGSGLAYAVMVVRIDERQAVNTRAIADLHQEVEALKRRAEENARVNAQQQTIIEIGLRQHQLEFEALRAQIEKLSKEQRAHEVEDRRRLGSAR